MKLKRDGPQIRCPVSRALKVIGGKWKPLLLYHLLQSTQRNSTLLKAIPDITQKVLTQQLRELEEDGIVEPTIFAEIPPRVDYRITQRGRSLSPVVDALAAWGIEHEAFFPLDE